MLNAELEEKPSSIQHSSFRIQHFSYTTWTLRPARRLRLIIWRPFLVRILERKPTARARFTLLILWG
jgi:hypothetical protein